VGMTECIACHQDLSNASWLATVFGDSAASQASGEGWLNGRHANNERPDAFGNMIGFPAYSDAWFTQPCQSCHDPIGEGTPSAAWTGRWWGARRATARAWTTTALVPWSSRFPDPTGAWPATSFWTLTACRRFPPPCMTWRV
jgi:hypothetical protein